MASAARAAPNTASWAGRLDWRISTPIRLKGRDRLMDNISLTRWFVWKTTGIREFVNLSRFAQEQTRFSNCISNFCFVMLKGIIGWQQEIGRSVPHLQISAIADVRCKGLVPQWMRKWAGVLQRHNMTHVFIRFPHHHPEIAIVLRKPTLLVTWPKEPVARLTFIVSVGARDGIVLERRRKRSLQATCRRRQWSRPQNSHPPVIYWTESVKALLAAESSGFASII